LLSDIEPRTDRVRRARVEGLAMCCPLAWPWSDLRDVRSPAAARWRVACAANSVQRWP